MNNNNKNNDFLKMRIIIRVLNIPIFFFLFCLTKQNKTKQTNKQTKGRGETWKSKPSEQFFLYILSVFF